jgi:transcriptional antiterminator NusG
MEKELQEKKWYALHTYSGYEDAVARYLEQRVESLDMHDKIFKVLVPKEKKIKIKGGKREVVEEKLYPGYVFVSMIMTDDSWYVVRNTPRVTGFVGADSTIPTPMLNEEIGLLLSKIAKEETVIKIDLRAGDIVKIIDGPFKDYDGKVSEIDEEKGKVKILVSIFGRETPLELDFLQVKKI